MKRVLSSLVLIGAAVWLLQANWMRNQGRGPIRFTDSHQFPIDVGREPSNSPAKAEFARANRLFKQGAFERAVAAYQEAIALDPLFSRAYNHLALAYQQQGDASAARKNFEKALDLAPEDAAAHSNFAQLLSELDDHLEALRHAEEAVRLAPGHTTMLLNKAIILCKLRRYSECGTELDKVLQTATSAHSLIVAAEWFEDAGDLLKTFAAYERALEIDAHSEEAALALKNLKQRVGSKPAA